MFVQVSGWIVFPILIAIYLGNWLDRKFDKEPWLFIICVAAAFVITNIGIVKVSLNAMKEITKEEQENFKNK